MGCQPWRAELHPWGDRSLHIPPSGVTLSGSPARKSDLAGAGPFSSCANRVRGHTHGFHPSSFPFNLRRRMTGTWPLTRGNVWVLPLTWAAGCGKRSRRYTGGAGV